MARISTFRAAKTKMKGKSFKPYPSGSGSTMFMFIFRSHILTIFRVTHFFYFLLHRGYFEMNTDRQPLNSLYAALFLQVFLCFTNWIAHFDPFPKGQIPLGGIRHIYNIESNIKRPLSVGKRRIVLQLTLGNLNGL